MSMLATIERFESGGGPPKAAFADGSPAFSRTTRRHVPRRGHRGYVHPYTQRAGFESKADFLDLGDLNGKQRDEIKSKLTAKIAHMRKQRHG
jgi:hypothetical protein